MTQSNNISNMTLAKCLQDNRNACLDRFVSGVHIENSPFYNEDILITRVRAGTFLDMIITYLVSNQIEDLNQFFQNFFKQMLLADYKYEHLKLTCDLLEQIIVQLIQDKFSNEPSYDTSLRSARTLMQLARLVVATQHLSHLTDTGSSNATQTKVTQNTNATSPFSRPVNSLNRNLSLQNERAKIATSNPPSFTNNRTLNNVRPISPGNQQNLDWSAGVTGYIGWPMTAINNISPPEYKASLPDGSIVNVLLANRPLSYPVHVINNVQLVVCHLRKIGPFIMAYP